MDIENMRPILELVCAVLVYVGGPILLIVWLIRRKKNPQPKKERNYKVLRPLPILINAPVAFVLIWAEETSNPLKNEEMWVGILVVLFLVTIIWSLIECKLAGIWIGPLRAILGLLAGTAGAIAVILLAGILMAIGVAGGNRKYISKSGEKYYLQDNGNGQYTDKYGNVLQADDSGSVHDIYGNTYDIHTE